MKERHLHLVTDNSVEYEYEDGDEPDWVYHPSYSANHKRNNFKLISSKTYVKLDKLFKEENGS